MAKSKIIYEDQPIVYAKFDHPQSIAAIASRDSETRSKFLSTSYAPSMTFNSCEVKGEVLINIIIVQNEKSVAPCPCSLHLFSVL